MEMPVKAFLKIYREHGKGYLFVQRSKKSPHLFEAQELEDGKVNTGVQPETTLVGAKGRVELDTVARVDMGFALVVLPDNAELHDALGDLDNVERGLVLGVFLKERGDGGGEFVAGLLELGLGGLDHFAKGEWILDL